MKTVAGTPDVSSSNPHARLLENAKPRRRHHKAHDAVVVPLMTALVAARPTCGYRRIAALLNRKLRAEGAEPVNHKRVYRIMRAQNLLRARRYTERADRGHDGRIVTLRPNLRPLSANVPFACRSTGSSDGFVPPGTSPCDALPTARKGIAKQCPERGQRFACRNGDILRGAFIIDDEPFVRHRFEHNGE